MFGEGTVLALALVLLVGLLTRESALFLLALSLLLAAGLSRFWQQRCLVGVEYRRRLSRREVNLGEEIQLEVEVVNRKALPLSWLEVEDEVSSDLPPARGTLVPSHRPGRVVLANLLALRPYERVRRRYPIPCRSRGEHLFGPVRLQSGDLFGFSTAEETREVVESVVVYPRVLPLGDLGLPAQNPLGDTRTSSWLFEDASRVAGAREYRPGDAWRRIHWPASVKAQQLMVRAYEATTNRNLQVLLNVATDKEIELGFGYDSQLLEASITVAASLASWALDEGYQVGLQTNGMHLRQAGRAGVAPGRGDGQRQRLLSALGRLQPFAVARFLEVLALAGRGLAYGTTVVIVTPTVNDEATAAAIALRGRGHPVTVLLTGPEGREGQVEGVRFRRVSPAEASGPAPEQAGVGDSTGWQQRGENLARRD